LTVSETLQLIVEENHAPRNKSWFLAQGQAEASGCKVQGQGDWNSGQSKWQTSGP